MNELLKLIKPRWHAEFQHFIRSGDASDEFLRYLEGDADAKRAVNLAIGKLSRIFSENGARVGAAHVVQVPD